MYVKTDLKDLIDSLVNLDEDKFSSLVQKALDDGYPPQTIIGNGISKALNLVGEKFESGEFFLTELIAAADITKKVLDEKLISILKGKKVERKTKGTVVIGTVSGDIHDIGKTMVASMLFAAGFEVYDLGVDVSLEKFIKKVKEVKANILCISALLSTTLPEQMRVIKALETEGIRNRVKILVGGAPVTREWAEQIGADGYADTAPEAVKEAMRVVGLEVV